MVVEGGRQSSSVVVVVVVFVGLVLVEGVEGYGRPYQLDEQPLTNKSCLGEPAVYPRKYVPYNGSVLSLLIGVSTRVTHQLVTQVAVILLKEVLGYPQVGVLLHRSPDTHPVPDEVLSRLSHMNTRKEIKTDYNQGMSSVPDYMLNMEVWYPADLDADIGLNSASEWGSTTAPGRFGWFIPKSLSKLSLTNVTLDQWRIFQDPQLARLFHIPIEGYLANFTRYYETRGNVSSTRYYCEHKDCKNGTYTPERCSKDGAMCATLLAGYPLLNRNPFHAPNDPRSENHLVEDIKDLGLYVKVVWVGGGLGRVVQEMVVQRSGGKLPSSSVVLFAASPGEVLGSGSSSHQHYLQVIFPPCEAFFKPYRHPPCRYNAHRIVKFAWSMLEKSAEVIYHTMHKMYFEPEDYDEMVTNYRRRVAMRAMVDPGRVLDDPDLRDIYWEVACDWMKAHRGGPGSSYDLNTWDVWVKKVSHTFKIGGMFPLHTNLHISRGIYIGAMMAEDAIYSSKEILQDYKLQLALKDDHCQPDLVLRLFFDYIMHSMNQLVGILGPACSNTVEPLAGIAKHYRVLVISYSAEGSNFSDRKKYPYFFRTIGENKQYMYVYLELLKKLKWKRIASLTEDGTKYTEYILHTQDLLQANNITFVANRKFPQDWRQDAMKQYLEELRSKNARIIVADVNDEAARAVMCEALRQRMTAREGYVWFLPQWLQEGWYNMTNHNATIRGDLPCNTTQMLQAIDGHFALSHSFYAPNDTVMQENITVKQWKENYARKCKEMHTLQSYYAGYAYDAFWTYALALDKLTKENEYYAYTLHSLNSTNRFVELIQNTDFQGVSGRIKFGEGSSRYSTVNVLQWINNEHRIVGVFYPNLTDGKQNVYEGGRLEVDTDKIVWLHGGDGGPPLDGTPDSPTCYLEFLANFLDSGCDVAWIVANIIGLGIVAVFIIMGLFIIKHRYDKKVQMTQKYMRSLGLDPTQPMLDLNGDKWEIPRDKVVINRKLGEGAFGTVYGGEAYFNEKGWVAVAVKTLKIGSTTEEKLDFLGEAEVMKRFEHKNVIKLLGVCTKNEPVYTIMEFMLYGDLKTFLLARRHLVNEKVNEESDEISCKKLTSMALDVARALSYLAQLKFVHRDVASRNCLVNASRTVKLSDFGMTRPMFDHDYYKFNRKGMLPVRWMAPESLGLGIFTPASDVWSFGVLLYEIITFGSFPFQGLSNNQVLDHVKAGNTITIPSGVKPQLDLLIRQCWTLDYKKRPQASEIVEFLANNPRLLSPCLDVPLSSVQMDDTGQLEMLPQRQQLRHRTTHHHQQQQDSSVHSGSGGGGGGSSSGWWTSEEADQPLLPMTASSSSSSSHHLHQNNIKVVSNTPMNTIAMASSSDESNNYLNQQDSLL